MQIYLLLMLMTVLAFFSYLSMEKDIVSPPVVFVCPFCAALICAAVYKDTWELDIHLNTMAVLLGGCFMFYLASLLVHMICRAMVRSTIKKHREISILNDPAIYIAGWKIWIFMAFQVLSLVIVIKDMRSLLSGYGISGSLPTLMSNFRQYHMFEENKINISSIPSNIRTFAIAGTYPLIYVFANNIVCRKTRATSLLALIGSILLGAFNCVILGARGEALQLIFAFIVVLFTLRRQYNGWKADIEFKQLFGLVLVAVVALGLFKYAGQMLGRGVSSKISVVDEAAKYLGAQIKNLDLFLENPKREPQIWGGQTFGTFLSWIGDKLHLNWKAEQILPFNKVNGISLGNVYTVFYAFYYDFGFAGVLVLPFINGILAQLFYEGMPRGSGNGRINFSVVLNSYILFLIAFSFFGERFFSAVLNITFIKYLVIWKVLIYVFEKKVVFKYSAGESVKKI